VDKSIEEFKDEVIAIDIAPYVIKAFFADAPAWHRGKEPTHTYRTILCRVIDRLLKHATRLIVVIDGARLPLKAAEHVRRGDATDREATMEQAAEQVYTTTVAFLAEWIDPASGETFPSVEGC
jgi:hypothetical protein